MTTAGPSTSKSPPKTETFATFHTGLQAAALKATRASAGLPVDLDFYKSVDEGIKKNVDRLEGRVLELLGRCIALADGKGKGKEVRVEGEDLVDDFHGTVIDFVDVLLEKTDICLDEYSGKLKRPAAPVAPAAKTASSSTQNPSATTQSKPYLPASLQHAATLSKPQLVFPSKVDNSDDVQTRGLKHKYNARVPLGYVLQKEDLVESFAAGDDDDATLPSHPYYFEITHLQHPSHAFTAPSSPSPLPNLPAPVTYVSTSSQFSDLLAHLTSPSVREIAVDLEHHSYRTYRGFLCLMQLTTRSGGDFIVDLLSPEIRGRMHELNEAFTNPNVVKVFHGAESDIVWLQQDFGVYVVGLFDTFHASKLLELPKHGLATLLELYADYTPDKKYQLADWRIRPLPEEMLHYAQSDTHWLLYLYDRLQGALADKEVSINSRPASGETSRAGTPVGKPRTLLAETLFRSSQTSLRQYTPEVYDSQRGSGPGGWDSLAKKWNKTSLTYIPGEEDDSSSPSFASTPGPTKVQRLVYRAVHRWRDAVAREEDESTRYVLPNHFLFTLAENAPADMNALLGLFRGGAGVPPVVRKRAKDLLETVREAVRRGLEGPKEEKEKREIVGAAAGEVEVPVLVKEDKMAVDGKVESGQSDVGKESGLWGTAATTSHMTTKSSSLLGTTSSKSPTSQPQPLNTLFTSKSALFGSVLTSSAAGPSRPKPAHNPEFKALVSKINSTLVIAPSVPKILGSASTHAVGEGVGKEAEMEVDFDPALGMHIDAKSLAYVPAAQRTTLAATSTNTTTSKTSNTTTVAGMEDMGPIVVVGRKTTSNRKKRKREQQQASAAASKEGSRAVSPDEGRELEDGAEVDRNREEAATTSKSSPAKPKTKKQKKASASPESSPQAEDDDTPYDFTTTPNVLDQGPPSKKTKGLADGKVKKGKGVKGKDAAPKGATGYFYSPEFGAPPKQRSDFKGGNKSHTFKG